VFLWSLAHIATYLKQWSNLSNVLDVGGATKLAAGFSIPAGNLCVSVHVKTSRYFVVGSNRIGLYINLWCEGQVPSKTRYLPRIITATVSSPGPVHDRDLSRLFNPLSASSRLTSSIHHELYSSCSAKGIYDEVHSDEAFKSESQCLYKCLKKVLL